MNERPAPVEPAELTYKELIDAALQNVSSVRDCYHFREAKHAQLLDVERTLNELRTVIAADRAKRAAPAEPADHIRGGTEMVAPPAKGEVGTLVDFLERLGSDHDDLYPPQESITLYRAADLLQQQAAELAMLRRQAEPPVEGEAWSVAQSLRRRLAQNPMGCADPTLIRAAELLERLAGQLATLRSAPHA